MKLRVVCNDPYATDSSSSEDEKDEEEYSGKSSCQKQFVREVVVPSPPGTEIPVPIAPANHDRHPAVEQTKSGKSGAFICDPVIGKVKTEWVGLYDTCQEIAVVYSENKLDSNSIVQSNLDLNSNITNSKCSIKEEPCSSAHGVAVLAPEDRARSTKHQGVYLTKAGKWGAHIWHAIRKKEIWLGTFSTAQEAADAYDRKKLELDSIGAGSKKKSALVSKLIKSESMVEKTSFSWDDGVSLGGNKEERHLMAEEHVHTAVEETKMGKCGGSMKHRMSGGKSLAHGLDGPAAENRVGFTKLRGVALTKWGKWGAHIWHPIKKKEIWLGAYFSAEEAADAYDRKRLEFETLGVRSKKKSASGCKATTQGSIKDKSYYSREGGVSLAGSKCERHIMEERQLCPAAEQTKMRKCGSFSKYPVSWERSSLCGLTLPVAENRVAFRKHKGVALTTSGKWKAHIWHPIKKKEIWLGAYFSAEEAVDAYDRKKLEFESLVVGSKKSDSICMGMTQDSREDKPCFSLKNGVSPPGNKDEGHIREEKHLQFKISKLAGSQSSSSVIEIAPSLGCKSGEEEGSNEEYAVPQGKGAVITSGNNQAIEGEKQPTIWQTQSGKCGTSIRNPIRKMTDWCGSYNTPEEAANVLHEKRLESETEICARNEERNLASKRSEVCEKRVIHKRLWEEFVVANNSDDADLACKRKNLEPLGVQSKKSTSGCKALAQESIEDKSCFSREDGVSLAGSKGERHIMEERHLRSAAEQTKREKWESFGKHPMNWERSSLHDPTLPIAENHVASTKHKGVALTKSGKWRAHIWHPIEKKEIGLGVHFSAEEAVDAYNRKKLEFECLVVGSKKTSASVDAYPDDAAIKNDKKPHNMLWAGNRRELDLCSSSTKEEVANIFNKKKLESQSPPTSASEVEKSGVTCVNSHESDGIGSNIMVEALSYTMEPEFGCGIINCYGQLLGEYSKLDDELWLSNPDEDDQDTMGSDELFAWELKPPVKLGSVV